MAVRDGLRADQALLQFVDRISTAADPDETHQALIKLASHFGFSDLYVTNVAKAQRGDIEGLVYTSQPLPHLSMERLAKHPAAKVAWSADAPLTFAEILRAKGASGSKLPAPLRDRDALSVNVITWQREAVNFVFAGERCDTSGIARSLLHVAARIACEDRKPIRANATLTQREHDVMRFLAEGADDDEIARRVGISRRTVRFHVANAKRKFGVVSRAQAIVKVLRMRAARPPE